MIDSTQITPTLEALRDHRDEIVALADSYGVYNIRVFGSVARGEAEPDSDIDLLIAAREGVSIFDLVGLWLDLKDLLGREVSLVSDETPDEAFLRRVLQDAVTL